VRKQAELRTREIERLQRLIVDLADFPRRPPQPEAYALQKLFSCRIAGHHNEQCSCIDLNFPER